MSRNDIEESNIQQLDQRDIYGQMSRAGWSCLVLDTADKLAPMLGREGMELYFRFAQAYEAYQTEWEGVGEAQVQTILGEYYVYRSHHEAYEVNRLWGATPEIPPYPEPVKWVTVREERIEVWQPYTRDMLILRYEDVYEIQIIEGHPEFGSRRIYVGRRALPRPWKTKWFAGTAEARPPGEVDRELLMP